MLELKNIVFEVPTENGAPRSASSTIFPSSFPTTASPSSPDLTAAANRRSQSSSWVSRPHVRHIIFNGQDITDMPIAERAKLGIGYGFQQPARFKGMKVKKLLDIAAGRKLPMLACNEYLAKVGLCSASYLTREVDKSLSGGEVKRIEIATHSRPRSQAGHLRRARGRHRPLELRQADRDVPRHPRSARRSIHRHHLPSGAHHTARRRDRLVARGQGRRNRHARRSDAQARLCLEGHRRLPPHQADRASPHRDSDHLLTRADRAA